MKTVVCFGDSNTWGADPKSPERYPPDVRWTGVLAAELGSGYRVIEEGLNGRTTNLDDPIEPHRNGLAYLTPCLESHRPVDLVTVMLGTNDLKRRFNRCASDIAQAAALVAGTAALLPVGAHGATPAVLFMAPPPLATLTDFDEMFAGGLEKSRQFGRYYRVFAERAGLPFLDLGEIVRTSDADGVHFDPEAMPVIGRAVAARVRELIG